MNPLISVIVPVYNVEPYLRRCLDSIIQQTYKNIEIIIVASTSPDNSVAICDEYALKDNRIIVIHSEPKGLSDARNRGIERAKGEFLSFIDSDDYIHPTFIETLYNLCIQNNCEVAQCNYLNVDSQQNNVFSDECSGSAVYSGRDMCKHLFENKGTANVVSWSKLYTKNIFESLRFPVGKIHEDVATTYKIFYNVSRVTVTDAKLYYYRQVENSIMGVPFSVKRLDSLQFREEQLAFFKEQHDEELYFLALLNYYYSYPYHYSSVKKYISDSSDIIKKMRKRMHELKKELDSSKYISKKSKVMIGLIYYFPMTVNWVSRKMDENPNLRCKIMDVCGL